MFELPRELIAQVPARPRDSSRLLHIHGMELEHLHFRDIVKFFRQGDVLVLNNSKVVPNKLIGRKTTGSAAEIIVEGKEDNLFVCRVKTKNPHVGTELEFFGVRCKIVKQEDDLFWLEGELDNVLKEHGELPQPEYIEKLEKDDHYQTVFGKEDGSLAAPTSGLHFTQELLDQIKDIGVEIVYVTLHISFGTFRPIRTAIEVHKMDPEVYEISQEAADKINNRKGRLFVCGTTSFKALESSADEQGLVYAGRNSSDLFIYPGHKFRIKPDFMITNFHFPNSTLILFVSAYFGEEVIKNAYSAAIEKKYRFYSLGDACLFEYSQPQ